MCCLRQSWVDLKGRELIIPTGIRKNSKELRVPIAPDLVPILERHLAADEAARAGAFLFTSRLGTPYTTDGLRSVYRRAVARAKIEGLTFHDLRHAVARDAGLSRESLYKALSGERSPDFDTILKVLAALGLRLHAVAASG